MKILTLLFIFSVFPLNAELYKWVDEKGVTNYSDVKPENKKTQEITIKQPSRKTNNITTEDKPLLHDTQTKKKPLKSKNKNLIMYSASWCGYCKKARAYFTKNNIRFKEYDIEKNSTAKRKYKKLGGSGVPLIVMGDNKMQGFNEAQFKRFYSN